MILAFDTSAAHCAAALLCGGDVMVTQVDDMARGQAEHLMPMLEQVLEQANTAWGDLTRIGVGIGPGNFTGIRISVSAARGLALGLGIPAIGVSTLDALAHHHPSATTAVRAPRDRLYVQQPGMAPVLMPADQANEAVIAHHPRDWIAAVAQIAARADPHNAGRPKPLYIKPADAAPARDQAPVILP